MSSTNSSPTIADWGLHNITLNTPPDETTRIAMSITRSPPDLHLLDTYGQVHALLLNTHQFILGDSRDEAHTPTHHTTPGQHVLFVAALKSLASGATTTPPRRYILLTFASVVGTGYLLAWLLREQELVVLFSPFGKDDPRMEHDEFAEPPYLPGSERVGTLLGFEKCSVARICGDPFREEGARLEVIEREGFEVEEVRKAEGAAIEVIVEDVE